MQTEVVFEPAGLQETAFGQDAIERRHCMAFGQKQVIARRIIKTLGVDSQEGRVQVSQEIGARQRSAQETTAFSGHSDNVFSDAHCALLEIGIPAHVRLDSQLGFHSASLLPHQPAGWGLVSLSVLVFNSLRWCRYQLTPANTELIDWSWGLAASKSRMSARLNILLS